MYRIFFVTVYLISCVPGKLLRSIFAFIRFFVCNVFKYRYSVIIQNISRSFPKMGYSDVKSLAGRYYVHMFNLIAMIIKLVSVSERKLMKSVTVENLDVVNSPELADRNIIIALGHYGNWEVLNILPKYTNHKIVALYSNISSSAVNKLMMYIRTRFGVEMLEISKAPRVIMRNKDNPVIYLFLSDQSAPASAKVCRFLNQDSYVNSGMEFFAKKLNAKVIYTEISYNKYGYNIKFEPVDTSDVTQGYLDLLQSGIEKAPEYWLWSHKRWKYYP